MPRVRILPSEKRKLELAAKIRYFMTVQNVSHDALALAARMNPRTLFFRFNDPGKFRLDELYRISSKLQVPLLELLGKKE